MDNQTNTATQNMPQSAVSTNQTPNTPPKRSSKGRLVLFGLLAIFIVGIVSAGAYVLGAKNNQQAQTPIAVSPTALQPSPASDENWKTYTNTKYQYTIGYPDFLKHTSEIANGVTTDKWVPSDNSYAIFVISYPDGVNSYLQFYADTRKDESISVVGQKVRRLVGTEVVSEKGTLVHIGPVKRTGQNHMLVYSSTSDLADSTGISVFDQMISSFKFTDKAQAGDMANWKTYTIDLYKLTLDLPSKWTIKEVNRRPEPTREFDPKKGHDCAEYTITSSDKMVVLSLKPTCGYSDGAGTPAPSDAVIVKALPSGKKIIRFYDAEKKVYRYAGALNVEMTAEDGTKSLQLMHDSILTFKDGSNLTFIFVEMQFNGSGNKEQHLANADKTIASIKEL